jgi:hypothetical protein
VQLLARLLPPDDEVHELVMDQRQDLLLAAHVVVEAGLAQAHRRGDLVHRHPVVAVPVEQLGCPVHDLLQPRAAGEELDRPVGSDGHGAPDCRRDAGA